MSNGQNSTNPPTSNSEAGFLVDSSCKLDKGSVLHFVKDFNLAVCLISLGIKLRHDPPIIYVKRLDGRDDVTFSFMPSTDDGKIQTKEMIKAYHNEMQFIKENPEHPMSYAMAVAKNMTAVKSWINQNTPYVAFKANESSTAVFYVPEGSKKHKNCVAKGMIQVDPQSYSTQK